MFVPTFNFIIKSGGRLNARAFVKQISIKEKFVYSFKLTKMTLHDSSTEKFSRLPTDVKPINYSITLQSNFETFKFTGHEAIKVKVIKETSTVVVNSADIDVNSASFKFSDGKEMKAANIETNEKKELLTIKFDKPLPLGDGELMIDFVGTHNDNMKGFYRSKNQTPDGKEEYSVITQFEPIDARRAFPCWDEPAIKATFEITLIVPKHLTAISNMNAISEGAYDKDANYKIVKFAPSPIMSTYLVAAAVGNYDYVEANTTSGVNVRVYTRKTKSEQGRLGLEFSIRVLDFYKQVFGIDYPLPKMDLLAAPDFCMGAMENWGLITYREACILYDPVECSSAAKQRILVVIAHEIAHQWFGNLVTMEWWTYLWLNEGFARFMEFYCVDALCPELQIWSTFISDTLIRALHLDGLHSSHPIEVPIDNPDDIDQIFDAISYEKGASVIRMLYRFIGDEHFRNGLKKYLSKFSYQNTVTEDLWKAFEEVSKKPVKKIMDAWIKQKGYPVVTVEDKQVGNDRVLTLKQEKFCSNGKPCDGDANVIWPIPIEVIKQSNPKEIAHEMVFDTKSGTLTVKNVKPDEWVKLNPSTTGVYRCQYSHEMLSRFYSAIESKELPSADRFGILSDVYAMVQSGRASTVELLKLMKYYVNEDDYTVWSSVCTCFNSLKALLARTDFHGKLLAFGRELFSKISAKLGYIAKPDDDHLTILLRTMILGMLADVEDEAFIKDAKDRFEKHCSGKEILPADMRGAVYHVIAAKGNDSAYDKLYELHSKADLITEKTRILYSLGASKDDARIKKLLQFTLSSEVREQDTFQGFMGLTSNHKGIEQSWQTYKKEFESINNRCTNPSLRAHIIKSCTTGFVSEEKANEVEAFFKENKMPSAERAIEQSIEAIRLKADWLKRDLAAVKAYLSE